MKLLFVVLNYYPSVGGTQVLFQQLAEYCCRYCGDEVTVYTTDSFYGPERDLYKRITPRDEWINGVRVVRFPFYRMHKKVFRVLQKISVRLSGKRIYYLNRRILGPWSPSLEKAIENTTADVIIGSSMNYMYMDYPLRAKKLKNRKPFLYHGAIHFPVSSYGYRLDKTILAAIKGSDFYLANTTYEKQRLVEFGVSPEQIKVTGIGIDLKKFDNHQTETTTEPGKKLKVGYIGRLWHTKGIEVLINAMEIVWLQFPYIQLIIAGYENEYTKTLYEKVSGIKRHFRENIDIRVNFSDIEKIALFQELDLLVLPSVNESFGIVFLEAWACKKPVIGAKIGAVASVVSDGIDGLLFEPGNEIDLSEKIMGLINDTDLRFNMGEAGFQKVKNHYTWEIIAKGFRSYCQKAISNFKE